jgi:hypothetical protein
MPWPARSKIKPLSDSPWPRPRWSGRSPGSRPRIMTRLQSGSADFFPRHAVEASGRASQFSKSPKRWAVSLARLLAVRAAVRASPGEPEGRGGCFSAFPPRWWVEPRHPCSCGCNHCRWQAGQISLSKIGPLSSIFREIFETTGFGKCSSPADRTRRALRWG